MNKHIDTKIVVNAIDILERNSKIKTITIFGEPINGFISYKVRLTRRGKPSLGETLLTCGKLNYRERRFVNRFKNTNIVLPRYMTKEYAKKK